ncbi:MAG: argininosuccinate lyase [Bacteroidota bacterium]
MKLWQKDTQIDQKIEAFTVGQDRELDLVLAPYDVLGSLAHTQMLASIDLLEEEELKSIHRELKAIYQAATDGQFSIAPEMEDVHSQVEFLLTERLGDIGKKIHSGRSRNDQVLVDLRLYFRAVIESVATAVRDLATTLLALSERYKDVLLPGYTHLQVAMPSSFGLWFGAYAESLADDLRLLESTYHIINQNPLGSAAGYGSSFPLDRELTTQLLGFEDLNYNVVHAQMGRGKTELFLSYALAAIGHTLSRLAMDVTLYSSQNFSFLKLPDELTTGSSIMPHKKNPDVFELIRAKCNQLQAVPQSISLITSGLPSGYHRDYQLLKENIFPAIESLQDCLDITKYAVQQIEINTDILNDAKYHYLYTVEVVNDAVLSGVPFREAYQKVGKAVAEGTYQFDGELQHTHSGSLGNLCTEQIKSKIALIWNGFQFEKVNKAIEKLLS